MIWQFKLSFERESKYISDSISRQNSNAEYVYQTAILRRGKFMVGSRKPYICFQKNL